MFSMPLAGVLFFENKPDFAKRFFLLLVTIFCILVVGFRYEVGCDWAAYDDHFFRAQLISSVRELSFISSDVGYAIVNWFVANLKGTVVGVNLICALISLFGLYKFCNTQPHIFLAFLIAVPYIFIVLFQGYTRQATAFGFELFALAALSQAKNRQFIFYILLATLFHKTALVLLPLAALANSKKVVWTYLWVGLTTVSAYVFFLADQQDRLWKSYVIDDMESSGGGIRVALNVLPAVLFLIYKDRFFFTRPEEKKMWFWISILCLLCVPLIMQSSTAVDRLALYLMPIQIYVFSRLPLVFETRKKLVIFSIVFLYFAVQFVWLNFSAHSPCWVPYHSYFYNL
jgi:hypothetical protein